MARADYAQLLRWEPGTAAAVAWQEEDLPEVGAGRFEAIPSGLV